MRHFIATALLFSAMIAVSATAKPHDLHHDSRPPHEAGFAPLGAELPHIKGIAPEIFANASKEAQIRALEIEADLRKATHKATQKFKDEREKLELNKRILQVKLYHAKAKSDEKLTKDLLRDIYQNEQALSKNKIAERELRDSEELKRVEKIYKEITR